MTNCNDKTYKFAKGAHIETNTYDYDNFIDSKFELLITDVDGTTIARVNPDYIQYEIYSVFEDHYYHTEYLTGYGFDSDLKDLSIKFKDGEFIIINGITDPRVIGIDNMDLTSYGQEVLGECFENTIKYGAPTFNDYDYSSDYSTNDNPSEIPYSSPMDSVVS